MINKIESNRKGSLNCRNREWGKAVDNQINDPAEVWAGTKNDLRGDIPNHAFSTWLDPISVIGISANELILEVPSQFFFEWIESHYGKRIENTLKVLVHHLLK